MDRARSSPPEFSVQFKRLTDRGRLSEAEALLADFKPSTKADARMKDHYQSQLYIHQGRVKEAVQLLEQTRQNHGDHLRVLADLVMCQHFLGNYLLWKSTARELQTIFDSVRGQICEDTFYRVSLLIAKTDEELGRLGPALSTYHELLGHFPEEADPLRHLNCLAQIVRIRSTLGQIRGIGSSYEKLLLLSEKDALQSVYLEVQHALMLAECILISPAAALKRMKRVIQRSDIPGTDPRLFLYDALDAALLAGYPREDLTLLLSLPIEPGDPFETGVRDLASDHPVLDPCELSEELNIAGHLRLLSLHARLMDPSRTEASRRKFYLLLDGLDRESRQLWITRMGAQAEAAHAEIQISVHSADRILRYEGKARSFERRKSLWQLLAYLADSPSSSLEQVTQALWGVEHNPSYFHRIRMTAKRLNQELLELCAQPDLISVSQTELTLSPRVRLIKQL